MSVLVAVADSGSLSAAGRALRMPLATVSRKIAELEAHLGSKLFSRSSRNIVVTEAGQEYLRTCRRILEQVDDAERLVTGEYRAPRGDLVVTAPIVYGRLHVVPIVAEFLATYPAINLRLLLADRLFNLAEDQIDAAIRIGVLPSSSLVAAKIGSVRLVTCGSPGFIESRGVPARPEELVKYDCVSFDGIGGPNPWSFRSGKRAIAVPLHSRLSVTTAEGAIDAAIAGLGFTRVFSYQVEQPLNEGRLALVLEKFEPPPRAVSIVHQPGSLLPRKLRAFVDFALPRLRARLAKPVPERLGAIRSTPTPAPPDLPQRVARGRTK